MIFSFDIYNIDVSSAEVKGEHRFCSVVTTKVMLSDFFSNSQILPWWTIDKKIQYSELIEVYYWLGISGVRKAGIVTNAKHLNQYEGFFDRLHFWEEEIIEFQKNKVTPPSPPIESKANFIRNANKIEYLKGANLSKFESFKKKFDSKCSHLLVSFDKRIMIKEYAQTMLEMRKHISSRRNEKSLKIYKTEFEKLSTESKRIIIKMFPFLIIERD